MTLQNALTTVARDDRATFNSMMQIIYPLLRSEGKEVLVEKNTDYPIFKIVREKEVLYWVSPKVFNKKEYQSNWDLYTPNLTNKKRHR